MGEEVSQTVKNVSDGTVTIAVERYQELLEKSAAKPPVVHRHVTKTPEVSASENKVWGGSLMGIGGALVVVGAIRYFIGVKQTAKL